MNKREVLKTAVSFVSSMAVGTLASMMIKNNVDPIKLSQKAAVAIGGFVLSDYISSKASDYMEGNIDKIFDTIDGLKNAALKGSQDDIVIENSNISEED